MKNKLLKRMAASALSLVLCFCTMYPITAFAVDEPEGLPYGITSEQDISVERLAEDDGRLADMKTQAEQYRFGVDLQGNNPVYGKLLSPFQLTSDEKLVEISMNIPQRNELVAALFPNLKIAVQNESEGAAVHFFPAEIDESGNKVTAEIPLTNGSTVLCALVSFQETQATTTPLSTNEFEQPESIVENAEGSLVQYTWKFQINEETGGDSGILGDTYLNTDAEIRLDLGALTLNPSSVKLTTSEGSKWLAFDIGEIKETADGSGVWIIELITPSDVQDNAPIKEQGGYAEVTLSFDAVLSHEDFIKGATFPVIAELGISQRLTSTSSGGGAILGMANVAFAQSPELTSAVTITPADMTIYQGGDEGYEGVYDDDQTGLGSDSLPHPLFKITPAAGSNVNPADLTFTNGEKSWTVTATEDSNLYYFEPVNEDQDPVRVTYTDKDGTQVTDDEFDVSQVGNTYAEYTIDLYPGANDFDAVRAKTDTNQEGWPISVNSGTLTVRAVEKETDATSDIVEAAPAEDGSVSYTETVPTGSAVAVVRNDTTYTLNDTDVKLPADHGASLLFDDIIESDGKPRVEALEDAVDTALGATDGTRHYEAKYLDLVDANNGNAWISSSEGTDIYWGYPATTDKNTNFTLVHFKDLHRDGNNSGFDIDDIDSDNVDVLKTGEDLTNTDYGIKFHVDKGGFSPFVLVWETEPEPDTYTITATAGANGTISPNGSVTVTEGTDQTFTITPNNGYHIEDVLVDGVSVGAVRSYTFTNVQANHTITATFERNSLPPVHYYTITATAGEGGAIAPDGTVRVAQGADRTFTISAAEGYVIADVLVDGESIGAVDSYTFENVRQNHTIEARFQPVSDVADPDDTGVSDWLNTDDHLAYLDGYPDNTFQPEEDMTRAEAAQMFYNLLRDQDVDTTVSFTDVAADAWYAEAVNTLATLEIVDGVGDNRFAPERTITRAEFTTMAMRFCQEIPTGENIFSDVDQDDWFYDYVVGSIQYGWINGYPDGTFRPNDTITRAEVTTIANRMLGRAADEAYVDGHQDQLRAFPDVTKGYWAYYDITEATNAHEYTKDSQGEDWTGLA